MHGRLLLMLKDGLWLVIVWFYYFDIGNCCTVVCVNFPCLKEYKIQDMWLTSLFCIHTITMRNSCWVRSKLENIRWDLWVVGWHESVLIAIRCSLVCICHNKAELTGDLHFIWEGGYLRGMYYGQMWTFFSIKQLLFVLTVWSVTSPYVEGVRASGCKRARRGQ